MAADTDAGVAELTSRSRNGAGLALEPTADPLLLDDLARARDSAARWLMDRQKADGHWVAELEGDTILESEYVLLKAFLGEEGDEVSARCCRSIRNDCRPQGGWAIYPDGPFDLSASVKAYMALKLTGTAIDDPMMVRAREMILAEGGARACNSFTRFYLALLGQIGYDECPTVPLFLIDLPAWTGFHLGAMSSWTRTMVVPLSIISALKPARPLPPEKGIAELFRDDLPPPSRRTRQPLTWSNAFLMADRVLKLVDPWIPGSIRRRGIARAERWMFDRFEGTDGLGAIFPPMIYTVFVLTALGNERDSEWIRWAMEKLDELMVRDDDSTWLQPCVSPVWDTAIVTIALADAAIEPSDEAAELAEATDRSAQWLLDRELRTPGDWADRKPHLVPSGWHFQYRNARYPDIDDTAMVLLALHRSARGESEDVRAAIRRGTDWLVGLQSSDGGWAAYDADINNEILTQVPFADHNAMLDPTCADITARIVELLGVLGHGPDHPAIIRGVDYLWRTQEPEGCWFGRWGVNYIYGTWQVLQGLAAVGYAMDDPRLVKAADWLESVQQANGGWGESCHSYDDRATMGQGETTASQTAWAVLGLIAAGRVRGEAVARGLRYLIETQQSDGSWIEDQFTGTGFPKVFYLKYHYYRIDFPLMALARARTALT